MSNLGFFAKFIYTIITTILLFNTNIFAQNNNNEIKINNSTEYLLPILADYVELKEIELDSNPVWFEKEISATNITSLKLKGTIRKVGVGENNIDEALVRLIFLNKNGDIIESSRGLPISKSVGPYKYLPTNNDGIFELSIPIPLNTQKVKFGFQTWKPKNFNIFINNLLIDSILTQKEDEIVNSVNSNKSNIVSLHTLLINIGDENEIELGNNPIWIEKEVSEIISDRNIITMIGSLRIEGEEDKNRALFRILYFDEHGNELKAPNEIAYSKSVGSYKYLPTTTSGSFHIPIILPKNVKKIRLGFQTWFPKNLRVFIDNNIFITSQQVIDEINDKKGDYYYVYILIIVLIMLLVIKIKYINNISHMMRTIIITISFIIAVILLNYVTNTFNLTINSQCDQIVEYNTQKLETLSIIVPEMIILINGGSYSSRGIDGELLERILNEKGINCSILQVTMPGANDFMRQRMMQEVVNKIDLTSKVVIFEERTFGYYNNPLSQLIQNSNSKESLYYIQPNILFPLLKSSSIMGVLSPSLTLKVLNNSVRNLFNIGEINAIDKTSLKNGFLPLTNKNIQNFSEQFIEIENYLIKNDFPELFLSDWQTRYVDSLYSKKITKVVESVYYYTTPVLIKQNYDYYLKFAKNNIENTLTNNLQDNIEILRRLNDPIYWYDKGHLSSNGAEVFTNYFAESILEVLK